MLEGILWDLKCLSDLSMHGTLESKTNNVHEAFLTALTDILNLQNELYTLMANENIYPTENVSASKITKAKGKYLPKLEEA